MQMHRHEFPVATLTLTSVYQEKIRCSGTSLVKIWSDFWLKEHQSWRNKLQHRALPGNRNQTVVSRRTQRFIIPAATFLIASLNNDVVGRMLRWCMLSISCEGEKKDGFFFFVNCVNDWNILDMMMMDKVCTLHMNFHSGGDRSESWSVFPHGACNPVKDPELRH